MSEGLLTVLKFLLVALLYLFLARVVRVAVGEMGEPVAAGSAPRRAEPGRLPRERQAHPDLRLEFVEPAARRAEVVAVFGELTMGRAGGCDLVLADDTFVSQVHARVFRSDDKSYAEDLGSTNGTLVNGTAVTAPVRLKRGDRLQVGETVLKVVR